MLLQMSTSEWIISFGFVCCLTYIVGWLADGILQRAGFGHVGNWLLMLAGAYAAMFGFNSYGYNLEWDPLFTLATVSSITFAIFFTLCLVKRVFE